MVFFTSTIGTLLLTVGVGDDYFFLFRDTSEKWSWCKFRSRPDYLTKEYSWAEVPPEALVTHRFRLIRNIAKLAIRNPKVLEQHLLCGEAYSVMGKNNGNN